MGRLVTGLAHQDNPDNSGRLPVSMFVDSTARRAGVGVALVEAAFDHEAHAGDYRLLVNVERNSADAGLPSAPS
jgi:GNAT superfamily N-acetyltransferase